MKSNISERRKILVISSQHFATTNLKETKVEDKLGQNKTVDKTADILQERLHETETEWPNHDELKLPCSCRAVSTNDVVLAVF